MIVTEDCEPELPPVSMSIGMNAVSTTCAASAFSKPVMNSCALAVRAASKICSSLGSRTAMPMLSFTVREYRNGS